MNQYKYLTLLVLLPLLNYSNVNAKTAYSNHLTNESSPYLQQHANNPVNWYPWGEEAFAKARKEDKPVFISIGYSTCHWCHVMAHESFENKELADILNQHFISVKVDREERPDIDRIYLTASEIMNGYSGWPTTIITNTALKPFFATTYLPLESQDNNKGLREILNKVVTLWKDDRANIERVAGEVTAVIKQSLEQKPDKGEISAHINKSAFSNIKKNYDTESGGFSSAPKFPRTPVFNFMLAYGENDPQSDAHQMLFNTLDHLTRGGIYDHVGGGFHRYSVDAQWQVPHFEKMLYDQALILNALLDADKIRNTKIYQPVIQKSIDFVLTQMRDASGGFYSAYDADSTRPDNKNEHGEGAYYVWSEKELSALLSAQQQTLFYAYFNIQKTGNVSSDPQQEFTGLNVLYADRSLSEVATELKMDKQLAQQHLQQSLQILKQKRAGRPKPHLDDKIITSWNGLMISALTKAAVQYDNNTYRQAAEQAMHFILNTLYNPEKKVLYRSFRQGKHSGEAYLDDYVYLINALITLHKTSADKFWLQQADQLTQQQIALFYDTQYNGFFDNSSNDKNILVRSKEIYDGVLPSANAVAITNLNQLATLLKRPQLKTMALESLQSFHQALNEQPENYPQMLTNLLRVKK